MKSKAEPTKYTGVVLESAPCDVDETKTDYWLVCQSCMADLFCPCAKPAPFIVRQFARDHERCSHP
ncbi:MAG: hypothetical protein ACYTEQ_29540 [Planctomycetota bacterium]|jgi:hypothetical protein